MKFLFFFSLFITLFSCTAQNNTKNQIASYENRATQIIYETLYDSTAHNALSQKIPGSGEISTKEAAIFRGEKILFDLYGKSQIIGQKPYNTLKTEKFWIIEGTFKEQAIGGVFLIVINAHNGDVIRVSHGK